MCLVKTRAIDHYSNYCDLLHIIVSGLCPRLARMGMSQHKVRFHESCRQWTGKHNIIMNACIHTLFNST